MRNLELEPFAACSMTCNDNAAMHCDEPNGGVALASIEDAVGEDCDIAETVVGTPPSLHWKMHKYSDNAFLSVVVQLQRKLANLLDAPPI